MEFAGFAAPLSPAGFDLASQSLGIADDATVGTLIGELGWRSA
jgi:hypothetical protein